MSALYLWFVAFLVNKLYVEYFKFYVRKFLTRKEINDLFNKSTKGMFPNTTWLGRFLIKFVCAPVIACYFLYRTLFHNKGVVHLFFIRIINSADIAACDDVNYVLIYEKAKEARFQLIGE